MWTIADKKAVLKSFLFICAVDRTSSHEDAYTVAKFLKEYGLTNSDLAEARNMGQDEVVYRLYNNLSSSEKSIVRKYWKELISNNPTSHERIKVWLQMGMDCNVEIADSVI